VQWWQFCTLLAFDYWKNTTALTEENYPYTGLDGTCQNGNFTQTKVKTTGFNCVVADETDAMKAGLALQPLKVSIRASALCFQFYSSGVLTISSAVQITTTPLWWSAGASKPVLSTGS